MENNNLGCSTCKAESCILRSSGSKVVNCDFVHIGLKEGENTFADLIGD